MKTTAADNPLTTPVRVDTFNCRQTLLTWDTVSIRVDYNPRQWARSYNAKQSHLLRDRNASLSSPFETGISPADLYSGRRIGHSSIRTGGISDSCFQSWTHRLLPLLRVSRPVVQPPHFQCETLNQQYHLFASCQGGFILSGFLVDVTFYTLLSIPFIHLATRITRKRPPQ